MLEKKINKKPHYIKDLDIGEQVQEKRTSTYIDYITYFLLKFRVADHKHLSLRKNV